MNERSLFVNSEKALGNPEAKPQLLLVVLTALGGAVVALAIAMSGRLTIWKPLLIALALLPYGVIAWWIARRPLSKEGPAIAIGTGLFFSVIGLIVLKNASGISPSRVAFEIALLCTHLLMISAASLYFRRCSSDRPRWQILFASITGPFLYYRFVFLLSSALIPD